MASVPTDIAATIPTALTETAKGWRLRLDERLRPLGLSSSLWAVIRCLAEHAGPLAQRELAELAGIEGPTLVRLLDRLEEGGWARRRTDPGDRRVKRVELTAKALPCYEALAKTGLELSLELLRDIPETDIETTRKVLATISQRLGALDAQAEADEATQRNTSGLRSDCAAGQARA